MTYVCIHCHKTEESKGECGGCGRNDGLLSIPVGLSPDEAIHKSIESQENQNQEPIENELARKSSAEEAVYEEKARKILEHGDVLGFIDHVIQKVHVGDRAICRLAFLSGLSSSIANAEPIHLMLCGRSGKGKSDIFTKVLKVFPPGSYHTLTSISPKAFLYAGEKLGFDRKVIYVDEAQATEDGIPLLRALTSNSNFRPEHWSVDFQSKEKFLRVSVSGKYTIWLSSVDPTRDDQLLNRFILGNPDESAGQDEAVHSYQKTALGGIRTNSYASEDFQVAMALTRLLRQESQNVVLPFIDAINFPYKENRRNFPFFINIIKASTFANKFQRPAIANTLVATCSDFDTAIELWDEVSPYQSSKVSKLALRILEQISDERRTRAHLAELAGMPSSTTAHKLEEELVPSGLVNKEKSEGKWYYWKPSNSSLLLLAAKVDWSQFDQTKLQEFFAVNLPDYLPEDYSELVARIIGHPPINTLPSSKSSEQIQTNLAESNSSTEQPEDSKPGVRDVWIIKETPQFVSHNAYTSFGPYASGTRINLPQEDADLLVFRGFASDLTRDNPVGVT